MPRTNLLSGHDRHQDGRRSSIPTKGTRYWYLQGSLGLGHYIITETTWSGGIFDRFRMVNDNVFMTFTKAQQELKEKNQRLSLLL